MKKVDFNDLVNWTDEQLESLADEIENAEHFEEYDYAVYSFATGWGATKNMILLWGAKHMIGTPEQKQWIEDWLDDINWHTECRLIEAGKYEEYFKAA